MLWRHPCKNKFFVESQFVYLIKFRLVLYNLFHFLCYFKFPSHFQSCERAVSCYHYYFYLCFLKSLYKFFCSGDQRTTENQKSAMNQILLDQLSIFLDILKLFLPDLTHSFMRQSQNSVPSSSKLLINFIELFRDFF